MKLKTTTYLNDINYNLYDFSEYDNDLDDGRTFISDICEVFADTGKIQFMVSGFGDSRWPVDCRFDLPTIIEQLPGIIKKIKKDDFTFNLDFYEQGVERKINFKDDKDSVILECISRSNWIPKPIKLKMKKREVSRVFNGLYKDFMVYSTTLCSRRANHYLFKEWMDIN